MTGLQPDMRYASKSSGEPRSQQIALMLCWDLDALDMLELVPNLGSARRTLGLDSGAILVLDPLE